MGRVTQSSVLSDHDPEGASISPKIVYRYNVDGKDYESNRYQIAELSASYSDTQAIVDSYPVGKTIDVFYDRTDPAKAVLRPGIGGSELAVPFFMAPFNLIMIGLWASIREAARPAIPTRPAGGAKIFDDGLVTNVRLLEISPLAVAVTVVGVLALFAMFPIAFVWRGNPPLGVMLVVWIVLFGVGRFAYNKIVRADDELVIDDVGRRVTLPKGFGRAEPLAVPLDKVVGVQVATVSKTKRSAPRYQPVLVIANQDGSRRCESLVDWCSQTNALAFAAWLRERLRLPPVED